MVKLPKESKETGSPCIELLELPNYHLYLHSAPEQLLQLEELTELAAYYMRPSYTTSNISNVKQLFMDCLRRYFNLEFKMRCHRCGTPHYQDEITAPER